jgi:hypothetical protein
VKAQVVSTRYPQMIDGERYRREHGEIIEVEKDEFERGVELGVLRKPSDEPVPEPNASSVESPLTQPDGTPIGEVAPSEGSGEFKAARTHAEADAMAADLGVTFPDDTKLDAKNEALAQVVASGETGEPTSTENLADLSDEELVQRGIDFGHSEEEMVELDHDALVLFVAEAMNRQGDTTAQQQASVAERAQE